MAGWDFEVEEREHKKKREWIEFKDLILYEDDRVIVVNKPGGISCLEERGGDGPNLLQLARRYHADAQICHRLDKNTSGTLIFSKENEVYKAIAKQFAEREVIKLYVALVHGVAEFEEYMIDVPIGTNSKNNKARIDTIGGKESLTVVDTVELFRQHTLVNCHPITGRLHQIRVHMAYAGYPLVGDPIYGGKDIFLSDFKKNYKINRKNIESPINEGFMLHARGLRFTIPGDTEESDFIAPVPKKFEVALKILRKYAQ